MEELRLELNVTAVDELTEERLREIVRRSLEIGLGELGFEHGVKIDSVKMAGARPYLGRLEFNGGRA